MVSTDAHSVKAMNNVKYVVAMARRGHPLLAQRSKARIIEAAECVSLRRRVDDEYAVPALFEWRRMRLNVVLEVSERPVLASNVDLSEARVGGLDSDLVTDFLLRFAEGAGITLHVRLIAGDDAQHVLEAMFKALGVALRSACRPRKE